MFAAEEGEVEHFECKVGNTEFELTDLVVQQCNFLFVEVQLFVEI
jgi:hypothetical protein